MTALVHHDSDGDSEPECSSPTPLDEGPKQPHVLPDTNAIIRETTAEMEQARGKVEDLIRDFAKTFVDTAGRFREEAIQRYRGRLEELPTEVCVEVCDTLARNNDFCGLMDFGYGNLMSGGMHFIYKVESDAAFNALSHHAWKDFHQSFLNKDSSPPLSKVFEQSRPPGARQMGSDDDDDELAQHQDRIPASSEESDLSSVNEVRLSSGDSTEASETLNRERGQSSFSPSQNWDTDDQSERSDVPRRRVGPQSKDQSDSDALERRRPTRPPNKPWSAEEESLIRERMDMQQQMHGGREISRKTATNLMKVFPGRTGSAIRNKWQALAIKNTQYNRGRKKGKIRAYNTKAKVQDEDFERKKRYEEYADSTMEDDDGDRDASMEHEVKRGPHEFSSHNKITWTPQQDQLLTDMMHAAIQLSGLATTPVPSAVRKKLAKAVGCSERTVSRRWLFLSGHDTRNRTWQSRRKIREKIVSISVQNEPRREFQAPESSSRLPLSNTPPQSEAAQASALGRQSQPTSSAWSVKEHESIVKSTKGKTRDEIDFKEVAAELPYPFRRSAKACRSYWSRKIQSLSLDKGQPLPRCLDPTRAPKSDRGSSREADTVISVAQPSKHARESDDESEKRCTTRRRTHDSLPTQYSLSINGHEDGTEAKDALV